VYPEDQFPKSVESRIVRAKDPVTLPSVDALLAHSGVHPEEELLYQANFTFSVSRVEIVVLMLMLIVKC